MRVNKKSIRPINTNKEKAVGYTDNICAPATASGRGAIGIIRMSGPDVIKIADSIFTPTHDPKRKPLSLLRSESYVMRYGVIYESAAVYESAKLNKKEYTSPLKNKSSQQKVKQVLDEVLVTVFRAPHSYTGENSVEFYCHASSYIMNKIIMMLIAAGARMAEPGEFTKRAFLNGRWTLLSQKLLQT
jgi:tRNA modification GTPase